MAIIIQSRDEETISLPVWLMQMLEVQEGDEVRAIMDGNTLQLTPLEKFLNLRGIWADDDGFSEAIELLEQAWPQWTPLESA
jgi:hypothetical protein